MGSVTLGASPLARPYSQFTVCTSRFTRPQSSQDSARTSLCMEPLHHFWRDFLEVWRVPKQASKKLPCVWRFHTKTTSKKSSPRSRSMSFSSREAGWKIVFLLTHHTIRHKNISYPTKTLLDFCLITVTPDLRLFELIYKKNARFPLHSL